MSNFNTLIKLKNLNTNEAFEYPYFDNCSVQSASADLTPTASFSIRTRDQSLIDRFPVLHTEVEIWQGRPDNKLKTFSGFLQSPPKGRDGSLLILDYNASGWYDKTRNIIVNESYDSKSIDFIVNDLHNKYLIDFEIGVIEPNDKIITNIRFSLETLYDAFERLAGIAGYISYIDNMKKYNFHSEIYKVNQNSLTENPFTYYKGSAKFDLSTDNIVNRLYIQGGLQTSDKSKVKTWVCNGVDKTFNFGEEVAPLNDGKYHFYYNDTEITSGIKGTDNFSDGFKVLVDEKGSFETFETYINGAIKAEYKYKFPIFDIVEDLESQRLYGVIEKPLIIDSSDRNYILDKANFQLAKYSYPILKGNLEPFEPVYQAGEVVLVDIPTLNISQYLKIVSVSYDSEPKRVRCSVNFENNNGFEIITKALEKRIRALEKASVTDDETKVNKLFNSSDMLNLPVISDSTVNYTHTLETVSNSYFCEGGNYI